jgi:hypothetical protein
MKKIIILIFLLTISVSIFAQKKKSEIKHIDIKKDHVELTISGLNEIDGHVFLNDTCKVPVIYRCYLYHVNIFKGDEEYEPVDCDVKGCKINHLVRIKSKILTIK